LRSAWSRARRVEITLNAIQCPLDERSGNERWYRVPGSDRRARDAELIIEAGGLRWLGNEFAELQTREVRFETDDAVDDLVIVTASPSLYIQAKRGLTLGTQLDSEFSKVLRQFAAQYLREPTSVDPLLLVTTPDASSKITADLRKLTRARRLNLSRADRNPASKRERGVLDLAKAHLRSHLSELSGAAATNDAVRQCFGA
jgi:hypothetical protein